MISIQQAFLNVASEIPVSDPSVQVRLDRGYGICISHGYTMTKQEDGTWLVHRASTALLEDNSITYHVSKTGGCTCPDAVDGRARAGLCKHRLAVMLKEEMEGVV